MRPHTPSPAPPASVLPAFLPALLLAACSAAPSVADSGTAPAAGTSQAAPEHGEPVTIEWIYSGGPAAISAMPSWFWRPDGRAILLDPRRPIGERTLELFDPETMTRTPLLDAKAALATLAPVLGSTPPALPWPDSFDHRGTRALYPIRGDVFVLDLDSARFIRLTATPAVERAAQLSPDGSKVAFVRDNDLYAIDIDSAVEKRLTSDGSPSTLNGTLSWVYWEEIFGRQDTGYWWSPDSSAIAYLQSDESPVTEVSFVHFRPEVPRVLTQRYPKTGTTNPTVRVGVVAIGAPETTWMDIDVASYEYLARVKWMPDSRELAVQTMSRDQRRLDLHFVDRATGEARHVLTETDEGWVNIHDDLYFLEDRDQFVWASERDGYEHLYLYDMDGTLVRQVTAGEWAIRSGNDAVFWLRQAVAAIDEDNGWIYFSALTKSSVERQLYRIRLDGTGMERLTEQDGSHAIDFGPHARFYVDRFSAIDTPPGMTLCSADGRQLMVLAAANLEELRRWDIRHPELLEIPARDGFMMPAQLLKPRDFDPQQRYPVIMEVYAGPSAPTVQNAWQSGNYFDQVLLRAGYLVCKVDNRSATAISKKLENDVLLQMIGDSELEDLVDAARWLKQRSFVDPDRVGIWGWSNGGSTTLLLMTRSEEFRAGIAVAPVTNWRYYDTKWGETTMKTPEENPEGYQHTDLTRRAGDLHGRLLLVHGTYDDNVHPQNSWHFIDELVRAGIPFDMMMYPMRQHGIADRPARIHLFEKMVEFWKLYL